MSNFNNLCKLFAGMAVLFLFQTSSLFAHSFIVKYERIEADQIEDQVSVRWLTVSEFDNDFFTIQRSLDGELTWEDLGNVSSTGSIPNVETYEFVDEDPAQGTIHYRLRQTDFDGTYTYSHSVSVFVEFFAGEEESEIQVYPNPSDENVTLETSTTFSESVSIIMTDISGKTISISTEVNDQQIKVQPTNKLMGLYFIMVTDQQKTTVKKVKFK